MTEGAQEAKAAKLLSTIGDYFEYREETLTHRRMYADAIRLSLMECFPKPASLHSTEYFEIFRQALLLYFKDNCDGVADLRRRIRQKIAEFEKRNVPTKYSMGVLINIELQDELSLSLWGERFVIKPAFSKEMRRQIQARPYERQVKERLDGSVIITKGSFRSLTAAGYELSRNLEAAVSALNMIVSPENSIAWPVSMRASYLIGKTFTIYSRAKPVPADVYWINEKYVETTWARHDKRRLSHLHTIANRRVAWTPDRKNPFFEHIKATTVLLNDSYLAQSESERCHILWSCIEKTFSDDENGRLSNSKKIAVRASRFLQDRETGADLIMLLSRHRNDRAHHNTDGASQNYLSDLNDYATSLILHILRWLKNNGRKFEGRADFLSCVDLPADVHKLSRLQKLVSVNRSIWHSIAE